eukprot:2720053-Rhodomonas_salina.1
MYAPNPGLLRSLGANSTRATTNVDLQSWCSRPYNLKVALLSSIGGLNIRAADGSVLHCNTRFNDSEQGFVQVAQQGANLISAEGGEQLLPHVLSSAWVGGGLFSDTTYHLAKDNSYTTPLCNWAALNMLLATSNSADIPGGMFRLQTLKQTGVQGYRDSFTGTNTYLANFLPYQPNRFQFTLDNAHAASNGIDLLDKQAGLAHSVAATFAAIKFSDGVIKKLLAQCDVQLDTMTEYHNFLVPFNSPTGTMDDAYKLT